MDRKEVMKIIRNYVVNSNYLNQNNYTVRKNLEKLDFLANQTKAEKRKTKNILRTKQCRIQKKMPEVVKKQKMTLLNIK